MTQENNFFSRMKVIMDRRNLLKAGLAGFGAIIASHPAFGSDRGFSAGKSWAIVYGTRCGSSRDAANWINDGLGGIADVINVSTSPKPEDYAFLIIGGPIQSNVLIDPVKSFIVSNKAALKNKIKGLFTLCGNNGNTTLSQSTIKSLLTDQIVQFAGVGDVPARLFLGRSTPSCGGLTYDNLKKTDCEAFSQEILKTMVWEPGQTFSPSSVLLENSPNPFNLQTTLLYCLPRPAMVTMTINALDGRKLATLVSGFQAAGNYRRVWNGSGLAPGYYVCWLKTGQRIATRIIQRVEN
jgi:flavodoxin